MADRKQVFKEGLIWSSLGGNNEAGIGGNCHLYAYQDDAILVDMGSMFAKGEAEKNFNSTYPDATRFFPKKDGSSKGPVARALVVTHGHMDHIGGIAPQMRRMLDEGLDVEFPEIYATPMTASMIKAELIDKQIPRESWPTFHKPYLKSGEPNQIGKLTVTPIDASHSIPNGVSLAIETPGVRHFHSGDVKADQTVFVGPPTDFAMIEKMRDDGKGFDTMSIDSTRITRDGFTATMDQIGESYGKIFDEHQGQRAVIGVMGTSLEEIATIAKEAAKRDKTIVTAGGSIDKVRKSAQFAGLDLEKIIQRKLEEEGFSGKQVRIMSFKDKEAQKLNPEDTIVLGTGTQGEEMAAMPRAARGEHPFLQLDKSRDYVIMAAGIIPGNEKEAGAVLEQFEAQGLELLAPERGHLTHASGHGAKEDNRRYYEAAAPTKIIPMHGSEGHLDEHTAFIESLGIKTEKVGNWSQMAILPGGETAIVGQTKEQWVGVEVHENPQNWRDKSYSFQTFTRDPITSQVVNLDAKGEPQPEAPAAEAEEPKAKAAAPAPRMGR